MSSGPLRRALPLAVVAALLTGSVAAAPNDGITLHPPKPKAGTPESAKPAAPPAQAQTERPAQAPKPPAWAISCGSRSRATPPDCSVEQRLLLQNGQLVTLVRVTVPAASRKPTILVQTPLGLAIRSGVSLQLDGQGVVPLDVQTCDQGGCYAATQMSDGFLGRMLTAKKLTVRFTALNQQPVAVTVGLDDFASAYSRAR